MDFAVSQENGTAVVTTNVERLNAANAPDLKAELLHLNKSSVNNVVIDMSATRYCDSSGLSAILIANRLCKDTNGQFILCGLQSNVQKLIEIAQLDKVLTITASTEEALGLIAS
ncbi:MAG: anti-anti-sigma factor [Bacteroidetes bacterium RIFCSPHIGHO2_02_FULL_44_7]|nr:MAG: anti-anti-sigma factor [Bacteroidetes bacterium RIFCSPHIGHO2_02_FULL_44_7]